MKSRIVILLSVTLAVLVLGMGVAPKAMPTSPDVALANQFYYMYSVPFVCGYSYEYCQDGVKSADYATLIEIHNNSLVNPQPVQWKVTRSLPQPIKRTGFKTWDIPFNASRAIRCENIMARLGMSCAQGEYATGFVVILSISPLDVYVMYTNTYSAGGGSIDVEEIDYYYIGP